MKNKRNSTKNYYADDLMSFKICWPLKYPKIAWPTYHLENKVQKWSGTWFDKWGLFAIVAGYLNPFNNKNLQFI